MYVTNRDSTPEILEHGGTCVSHLLVDKESLRNETMGGYLELVSEFQVKDGAALEPHSHNSDEFYYMLEGAGLMTVAGEEREVHAGDLIRTPPNTIHSIRALPGGSFRALAFATSYMAAHEVGYTAYPEGGDPRFVNTSHGAATS